LSLPKPAGGYWRVAHRGASALAAENSAAALQAALASSVDMVELDVVADGERLRLAHSAEQLLPESLGLSDALALFSELAGPEVWLDLDVKSPGFEDAVLAALRAHGLLERTLLTSFHGELLRAARRLETGIAVGFSYPNDRLRLSEKRALEPFVDPGLALLRIPLPLRVGRMVSRTRADAAMLHQALVTPRVVQRCHRAGAAVFAWTVESEEDLRRVIAAGADGAIADDPSLFDD
jgi:glycerophosphoryl diester phosphodiesterase